MSVHLALVLLLFGSLKLQLIWT